jgi:hypothetical protein
VGAKPKTVRKHLVAALVISGLGVYMLVWILPSWFEQKASSQWPSVTGEIVESGTRRPTKWLGRPNLRVSYRYQVRESTFESDDYHRVMWSPSNFWYEHPNVVVGRMRPGASVRVWHDPAKPQRSTLRAGVEIPESLATWTLIPLWMVLTGAAWLKTYRRWCCRLP